VLAGRVAAYYAKQLAQHAVIWKRCFPSWEMKLKYRKRIWRVLRRSRQTKDERSMDMKHSAWAKHYGGRASPGASDHKGANGLAVSSAPSVFRENRTEQKATEEMNLKLTPANAYRKILVPVDGDLFAEHALPLALGIARRTGAEIRIVHVHCPTQSVERPETFYYDSSFDAFLRRRHQTYLNDLVRRLRKVTSVPVTPVFMQGRKVVDSLCEAAGSGADLVVMATHGRGLIGRLWFGSVGDELMQRLSVPLLFVRGYDAPADLTGDPNVRHVLITLDGSKAAEKVLEPALALGTLTGAHHTLLRVVPWVTDFSRGYPGPGAQSSFANAHQTEAWNYLRRVAKPLAGPTIRVHPGLVLDEESTASAILRYARAHDAELIALATRGRGGLSRVFQGSVADQVVRGASAPVLVCRQDTNKDVG
jgi:nucleotide-binding universal stress UspA family protein